MPRVISYTRFSSPRQSRGDSYRRQTEMALKWCLKYDLTLDTDFVLEDLGVSGYSGANTKRGALGALQKLCLEGKMEKGTILLIEALDRLTRLPLPDAQELLLSLINNGLTIVTLTDGKVWTKDKLKSLEDFMMSVLTLYRGFQESEYKSKRLRETFKAHRDNESNQAFGAAPGWLYRDSKTAPWQVDEAKASVVIKVFELSASGLGSKAIAGVANKEGWGVPTRLNLTEGRWHAQMPGIILRNRAVLGEHEYRIHTHEAHEEHWQGKPTGQVVKNFYPRIISDDLWDRSRASIATRAVAKRRDSHGFNIWSGLLFCGYCGAPLQRKHEKKGYSRASVSCSDRLAGITTCPTSAAKEMDKTLLAKIYLYAADSLASARGSDVLERIASLEAQLKERVTESERVVEAIVKTGGLDMLVQKAMSINEEINRIKGELETQRQAAAMTDDDLTFDSTFYDHAVKHLYELDDESRLVRAGLHLKLARLVKTIWVWAYDVAIVEFKDNLRLTVALPVKKLPSRVRPDSKHHKPPKPKLEKRPKLGEAFAGLLIVPEAQRRNVQKAAKPKPILYAVETVETEETKPWLQ